MSKYEDRLFAYAGVTVVQRTIFCHKVIKREVFLDEIGGLKIFRSLIGSDCIWRLYTLTTILHREQHVMGFDKRISSVLNMTPTLINHLYRVVWELCSKRVVVLPLMHIFVTNWYIYIFYPDSGRVQSQVILMYGILSSSKVMQWKDKSMSSGRHGKMHRTSSIIIRIDT